MQEYGGYGDYPPPGQTGYGGYGYPPPPPPPPRQPGLWRYLVVAVTAAALGAGTVLAIGHSSSNPLASQQPSSGATQAPGFVQPGSGGNPSSGLGGGNLGGNGLNASEQAVYSKVSPGLVIISTSLHYNSEAAAGTGMVLTSDGLVLTNNHVIASATSISATVLATGKTYRAKVLGYDVTGDIAAIQLQGASGLRTIPVGDSGSVKVGDQVLAMGNAQGQSQITPADGKVTALNQTVTANDQNNPNGKETLHGTIETDASIVSGDSGGALANSAGQVIGMNTAGNDGGTTGGIQQPTGFAIPINTALSIVHQITSGQGSAAVTIGYPVFIGIFDVGSTSSDPRVQLQVQNQGIQAGGSGGSQPSCVRSNADLTLISAIAPVTRGTLIVGVICGGPTANAGIVAGDVITAINGRQVGASSQLQSLLTTFKPGDTIDMTWADLNGTSHTAAIHLVAGPPR